MAINMDGLFTSPEQIRGNRIDQLMQQSEQRKQMSLLNQVAAGRGAQLAESVAGLFGLQSPEEKKAAEVQQMMATLKDTDDPNAYSAVAKRLNDMGYIKEAVFVLDRGRRMQFENTAEARAQAQEERAKRNDNLAYKKSVLEVGELERVVNASPALREILSSTDTSTPEGQQKAIQAAFNVSTDEGYRMMELFYKQAKMRSDLQMSAASKYASGTMDIVKDEAGNFFVQQPLSQTSGSGNVGSTKINLVPMAGSPPEPVGRVAPVEQYGESASEVAAREISTAGGVQTAKDYSSFKVKAVPQIPELTSSINDIDRALKLSQEIETGGWSNNAASAAQDFLGVRPANKAEFALLTAELMYKRLKPLFGGVISDSERAVIERVYPSILQNPEANFALLGVLKRGLQGELTRAEQIRDSATFEDYSASTKRQTIRIGSIVNGYEYIGGDPNSESSWKEVK